MRTENYALIWQQKGINGVKRTEGKSTQRPNWTFTSLG